MKGNYVTNKSTPVYTQLNDVIKKRGSKIASSCHQLFVVYILWKTEYNIERSS